MYVQLADLHTALASPRALELAHVTGDHEYVVVDEHGAPTGELRETAGDFGEIVFNLIGIGQMRKTADDRREDFNDVFDFDTDLQQSFKITLPD